MVQSNFESKVRVQEIIDNQIPEFILEENPKFSEFLRQYYISQEYQGGNIDLTENLVEYLKLDNLTPEVISGNTELTKEIVESSTEIYVDSTKGFPKSYGLFQIDDEIITYKNIEQNKISGSCNVSVGSTIAYTSGISSSLYVGRPFVISSLNVSPSIVSVASTFVVLSDVVVKNSSVSGYSSIGTYNFNIDSPEFIGCSRGFSGIESYDNQLVFNTTKANSHISGSKVTNLSVLFLQKFYEKIKFSLLPGLEKVDLYKSLNVNNFIKNSKSFYQSKGSKESFRILFNALYGIEPTIVDLETFLFKSSGSNYRRRKELLFENLSLDKDPLLLTGYQVTKNNNSNVFGSVSEVEIFSRNNKTYYKFYIFLGYDDSNSENSGEFTITPSSKVVEKIISTNNETVLTVDSTIGFENSGSIFCNGIEIFYADKSINQFLGCYTEGKTYINSNIEKTSVVYSNDTYFGYEKGDKTKKVNLRLLGVIDDIQIKNSDKSDYIFSEGDKIYVKHLGNLIKNPPSNKNNLQIATNSIIYNTSSRYELSEFDLNSRTAFTLSELDESSLKTDDYVEFLERNTEILENSLTNVKITSINKQTGEIEFDSNLSSLNPLKKYDIRRKLKTASSSTVPLKYQKVTCDVTNVYTENDQNVYIASNSLPSYEITKDLFSYSASSIVNFDNTEQKYTSIKFNSEVSFLSGDRIYYSYTGSPIGGLSEGLYYITVSSDKKEIKLFVSQSFISINKFVYLESIPSGTHLFTLSSQKTLDSAIYPQKLLKKIESDVNTFYDGKDPVGTETIGILVNGVEIYSPKSTDKIYYGSLESVDVVNAGQNYDVINPPVLQLSYGNAKLQPVVQGSIEKIHIDPQEFNIDRPITLKVSGGNGKNAILSPVTKLKSREVSFDARILEEGGGLSITSETITFLTNHNFVDGQKIIYDINNINNQKIGISSFQGSNSSSGRYLGNNSIFYAKVINSKTIQIYPTYGDYVSGINTVGFTTVGNFGIHKFKTEPKNVLDSIKIIDGGEGFTNRKLIVKPIGISTYNHTINFTNHGFSSGELVTYQYQTSPISGLSTSTQYYVLKVNDNSFRVCNAGVGGTDNQNYLSQNYIKFSSTGSGYQYFNYPNISLDVSYTLADGQTIKSITATPVVKGSIIQTYLYENGSNYGLNILNLENAPSVKILDGEFAQLTPIISAGKIVDVLVSYYGSNYYSVPDIVVESKSGVGALLRANILNGRLESVTVLNQGYNYSSDDTNLKVVTTGKNAAFFPRIRALTLDNCYKYGIQYQNYRDPSYEILYKTKNNTLQYAVSGYSDLLKTLFNESSNNHSPIIGWSYDGIPIYGPFGYSDPENSKSAIKLIESGYSLVEVENRVSTSDFPLGYFIDDYKFTNSGDLDEYNGRYCKTPEYPNGVYAYFSTAKLNPENKYVGVFPYFVGKYYRSNIIPENVNPDFNQEFDFNNSDLLRNTLPYKSAQKYGRNDFISNYFGQICEVESTVSGNIEQIQIFDNGNNFKVGDLLSFDNENTSGYGLECSVESVSGKKITSVQSITKIYENAKVYTNSNNEFYVKYLPNYDITNNSTVTITGLTSSFSSLNGQHRVSVVDFNSKLINSIPYGAPGIVTDLYLQDFPNRVSIGSSIKVTGSSYDQYFTILNYFGDVGILRVERTSSAGLSTANSLVSFLPSLLKIQKKSNNQTQVENYLRYFNPNNSIGVGTWSGTFTNKSFYNGSNLVTVPIPTQTIYLPNHGFQTNQKVILKRPSGTTAIQVSNDGNISFQILSGGETQRELFVINKSKDYIGIVTSVGLTSTTNGLYFTGAVGSDDYRYSFESTFDEILCNVVNVKSTVSVSTFHNLTLNDNVNLEVNPNKSVGIGGSSFINLKYNNNIKSITTKLLSFTPTEVNLQNSRINFNNHGLLTGDKVYYISTSVIGGLSTGSYYVHKVDLNNIKLCQTYTDSISLPPNFIKFTSVGIGTQELNLIQPKINVIKNNDLVFNVSDPSLQGYKLKLYINKDLTKEFISIASTGQFSLVGVNTIGVSTDAKITLKYSDDYPEKLYYTLEKNNELVKLDDTIPNSSEINFVNSFYSGTYNIFNVTNKTFDINLKEIPEESFYSDADCDILSYSTNSPTAIGEVNKIKIIDSGSDYKDIPSYKTSNSIDGKGLNVLPLSTNVGKLKSILIKNSGFEYSSDKTLSPKADILNNVKIRESSTLKKVNVIDGGKKYPSAPNLVVVDSNTGKKIDNGLLKAKMSGGGIGNANIEQVIIEVPVNGLPSTPVTIKSVDNSNGILIDRVESSRVGILTCLLKTPILGFTNDPFTVNEEVFIENIEIIPDSGIGFDSENHGYQFFKVINYTPASNPGRIEIKIPELYGNPGVAVTFQINTFATIVKKSDYPVFSVEQDYSLFEVGEKIAVILNSYDIVDTNLIVEKSRKNYLKLKGDYELNLGDVIKGFSSGYLATVQSVSNSNGVFLIGSENIKSLDWENEVGKTSNDSQFLPDNDYYQNLSYTIKSEKTWEQVSSLVNSIVHPIGTKNFVDTQISSSVSGIVSTGLVPSSQLDSIQSFISQSRVDVIKNLDFVKDYDVLLNTSRIVRFKNLKLTDYVEALSNRVLQIDDISREFSSADDNDRRLNQIILSLPKDQSYGKFLIQIKSTNENLLKNGTNEIQFTEIISLKNDNDAVFLEKSTVTNLYRISQDSNVFETKIADINPVVDDVKNYYFLFSPTNPYDKDYEIKILSSKFLTTLDSESSLTIGSSDIFNTVNVISPQDSEDIISLNSSLYSTIYSQIHILNKNTFEMNYVEIYAVHDGNNVYYSDYYFDGDQKNDFSYGFIGSFGLSVNGGLLKLSYLNENNDNNITVRAKTICFNDSSSGIGTYRFKSTRQSDNSERTIILDSGKKTVSTSSTIFSYDSELFSSIKSLVKISIGSTSSLHQLITIHDSNNSFITEYPMLLVGDNIGVGTFSSFVNQNRFEVSFVPSNKFNGKSINIQYYNEVFYTFLDEINIPQPLSLSPLYENVSISKYFGLNSKNINRLNFNLKYKDVPIFAKTFDPFDTEVLDPSSGTFTIDNHFFSTGERLIYKPKSTFIGLGQSSMGIPPGSITDTGISTNRLPSSVYAIKLSNNQFKIALTKSNATSGTAVTFTYLGEGNAHMFEMYKKNEKTLITINNLAQYPLTYVGISHSLFGNNGQIGAGNTFFTLSGISSIKPTDLLKVDDEYMKVLNVGIGTTNTGPILFFSGDKNIVEVERGFVGTSATSHLDNSQVLIYRGSYNISEDEIYFTYPPRGNIFDLVTKDERNLERSRASFSGRVFLRKDYTTNVIFDDISSQFTGIGETFILKSQGINTVGLGTTSGNGILFINGIYQTPFTENVTNYNFKIVENSSAGISSVVFTGIRNDNDEITISESDVNQNQLPRGGIIVSLGSTAGLGYAPLVGAKVKATLNGNGSITSIVGIATTGNSVAFTTVSYNNETGVLRVFAPSTQNLIGANQVKIVGLAFTCPSNAGIISYFPSRNESLNIIGIGTTSFSVQVGTSTLPHYYVGYGTIFPWYEDLNFGSGYREPVSVAITESGHVGDLASITANVGAGGTLSFTVGAGGTGYSNPIIQISPPSYQNLPIIGVSRLGIGETTDTGIGLLMNVEIGSAVGIDTLGNVGIGSTLFQVSSFKITRPGYNFKRGDIFKPVGLVTAKGFSEPIEEFKLAVLETYNDNFASWQFGELNLIDSIKKFQDGSRLNYPLYYNGELLSFQKNIDDPDSQVIDFDSLLVIFINGILQEPKISYEFNGGSAVRFLTPPKSNDDVQIYFYVGTRNEDSQTVDVNPILQVGDTIQIYSNNKNLESTTTQNTRTVFDFISSDLMETNLYSEQGVDDQNEKPIYWIKQKEDIIVNSIIYSKSRDSLEPQVYPTAKIIKNFSSSDTEVFVDNASFFDYEEELPTEKINLLIIPSNESISAGIVTAVVSSSGTIQSLSIVSSGVGYTGSSAEIKISNPYYGIGVGLGTTATASLTISGGSITNAVIINPGFGYTNTNPPQVIVNNPPVSFEECLNANVVVGFDGVITGISTSSGIGTSLSITFKIFKSDEVYSDLSVGYPIYIFDTKVGTGLTTIDNNENEIVGVSTSCLDNIYYVHAVDTIAGIITCNISNTTNIVGIATTGTTSYPVGKFSWGKISGFSRSSNPVSIGVSGYEVNPGLSSYPSIQRRGYGLRKTGALKKDLTT